MTLLTSAIDDLARQERRQALRALLRRPMLPARGPDEADYRLVRKHEARLRGWLEQETGWRLSVDSSVARLHKRVEGSDPTRGLADGRRPFSRRRYVLFALALAVLERAGVQTTLGRLADGVIGELGEKPLSAVAPEFTLTGREERADTAAVVRLLLRIGVLRRVEGDEQRFVDAGQDVLYDIEHAVLAGVLQTAAPPSAVAADSFDDRMAAVGEHRRDESDEARNRASRHRLTRRLLDDPVLLVEDLHPDDAAYLASQRRAITDRIREATGLEPEVRAEGIALLDPEGTLTDVRMPEGGAPGHLALLIATRLGDEGEVARAELELHTARLLEGHAALWGRTIRERPVPELLNEALARLRALQLIEVDDAAVRARPVLARFRLGDPRIEGRG